jgi:hypothetical protein
VDERGVQIEKDLTSGVGRVKPGVRSADRAAVTTGIPRGRVPGLDVL